MKKPVVLAGKKENLPYMALGLKRPTYNGLLVEASEISPETIAEIVKALGKLDKET